MKPHHIYRTKPISALILSAGFIFQIGNAHSATNSTVSIDDVYFAQTHVLKPDDPLFKLVANRKTLIKVHITSAINTAAPPAWVTLHLNGQKTTVSLTGPSILPKQVPSSPGLVQHNYNDSFTGYIPSKWVQPGLRGEIHAGGRMRNFHELKVGAPTKVKLTMFDIHYFAHASENFPAGWEDEIESKWPVDKLQVTRVPDIVFKELVKPPTGGRAAVRASSRENYTEQTGKRFEGEQEVALLWKTALKNAGGTGGRTRMVYVNIYNVPAGGQAGLGSYGGVGNGHNVGVLHHEMGHALSLPHWGTVSNYPYRGDMYGIQAASDTATHAGPTWSFDLRNGAFLPPVVGPNSKGGTPGAFKADPMWGGGSGDQENGYLLRSFSDYSVAKIQNFLEDHVLVWNEQLNSYASWNDATQDYTSVVTNNGVQFPVQRNVDVISILTNVSAVTPHANIIYPAIGPYKSDLINLFDPSNAQDRLQAKNTYCPAAGCDVSLRVVQGGVSRTYMLAVTWTPEDNPKSESSLKMKALNLPAAAGAVESVELLLTPDAETYGLQSNAPVIATWRR